MTKSLLSTLQSITLSAGKGFVLLWTLQQLLIYGYVARLQIFPLPPSIIEVVETSKPDPIIVNEEPEIRTEIRTTTRTTIREELTQDQLRRITLEEDGDDVSGGIIRIGGDDDDNDGDENETVLMYTSSRNGLMELTTEYESLIGSLRGKMQDLEGTLTNLHNILNTYKTKTKHAPHDREFDTDLNPEDVTKDAKRDALAWISNNRTTNTAPSSNRKHYQRFDQSPKELQRSLQTYLTQITSVASQTLTDKWTEVTTAHATQLQRKMDHNATEPSKLKTKKQTATKQDLDEFIDDIHEQIQAHTKNYYSVLLPDTKEGDFLRNTLLNKVSDYQMDGYQTMVSTAEGKRDQLVAQLTKRYEENMVLLLADGTGSSCVSEGQVRGMVEGGIPTMFQKKELLMAMVDVMTKMELVHNDYDYDEDEDGDKIWYELVQEAMTQAEKDSDSDSDDYDDTTVGVSSWAHANTIRAVILDNSLFPQVLKRLNSVVETVEGYNDMVDQVIDYVVGEEEEEGRSFGSAVGDKLTEALGAVPVPSVYTEMKQKAGILHSNLI